MEAMLEAQELARRFNEDEAVWRAFEAKRTLRKFLGSATPLPDEILDDLDWQAAERECREVRAVGFFNHERDEAEEAHSIPDSHHS